MALVLGAEVGAGFFVGRRRIVVETISGPTTVTLKRDDGQKFAVSAEKMTEVFPTVFIGIGPDSAKWRLRLLFEAPQTVLITREPR